MKYNFDKVYERRGSGSVKWDKADSIYEEKDILPLWVADMDFRSPECVVKALVSRAKHGIYGYASLPEDYFDAVTGWFKSRHGWNIEPEWILPIFGVVPAVNLLVQEFSEPGDGIIVQQPVYYPFMHAVNNNGRKLINSPLSFDGLRYEMDFADLEEKAALPDTKMMILCSPHNPVGRVWLAEELSRLADICLRCGVLLVSDEIHSDLIMPGHKHTPTALAADSECKIIGCYAPSKSFNLPGLSAAYMLIPDNILRKRMTGRLEKTGFFGMNIFGPIAQTEAYKGGHEWLSALIAYISDNYRRAEHFFKTELNDVKPIELEGTYLLWLDFRNCGLNAEELKNRLRHIAHVALDEGDMFGPDGEGFVRLNLACPRKILDESLRRIKSAF